MNTKVTNINKTLEREGTPHGLDYISDIVADLKAGPWMGVMMDGEDREAP